MHLKTPTAGSSDIGRGLGSQEPREQADVLPGVLERVEEHAFLLFSAVLIFGILVRSFFFTGVGEQDARLLYQTFFPQQNGFSLTTPLAVLLPIRACLTVFGTWPILIWVWSFLMSLGQMVLLYSLGKRLFQHRITGVLAALFCAVWAPDLFSATRLSGSLMAGGLVSLAAWIMLRRHGHQDEKKGKLLFPGLLFGLACWCGPWGWMLLPFSYELLAHARTGHGCSWKRVVVFYSGCLVALLFVYMVSAVLFGTHLFVPSSYAEPGAHVYESLPKTVYLAIVLCLILMFWGNSKDRLVTFWLLVPMGASLFMGALGQDAFLFLRNPENLVALSAPVALAVARALVLMYEAVGHIRPLLKSALLVCCLLLFVNDWGNLFDDQERYTARTRFVPEAASLIATNPHIPVWADAGAFSYLSLLESRSENRIRLLTSGTDVPPSPGYVVITEALEPGRPFEPADDIVRPEARTVRVYRKGSACAAVLYDGDPSVVGTPTYEETGSPVVQWAGSVVGAGSPRYLSALSPVVPVKGVIEHFFAPEICAGYLNLGGIRYANGIRMRSNSSVVYRLNGRFKGLEAVVGLDDEEKSESKIVVFSIFGDKHQLAQTKWLKAGDLPRKILVNLRGVQKLELSVVNRGDVFQTRFADWASIFIY